MSDLQARAARFLRWLYDDQAGYAEVVAGVPFTDKPDKIDLVMHTRRWCYLDPARPDLYDQAGTYIAQLSANYGNVYTSIRLYTKEARATNARSEATTKPSRVIFIDDAPAAPEIPYSASVRTSEHSRHAYYKCAEPVTKDDARRAAAALGGDPSGVDLTQLVRIPGTFNTKHNERWAVETESASDTIYTLDELRSAWPAATATARTTGTAWGEAYKPAEWENLPDGGPLWHSAYVATVARRPGREPLAALLRGERAVIVRKDDRIDDSDSVQIAALCYNLMSGDVCEAHIRAIALYLKDTIRPGRALEHFKAHVDAELVRYRPAHYKPQPIHYTGAPRLVEPLPPAEHKPEPKSRARKDRPQQVAGAAGYLAWLRTQVDAQSDSVMLSQAQCAARLGCCVRTIKRYEKALGTQIERRVFAQRQAGCLFILSPDVVPTSLADVVIADAEITQQSAENVQPAIMQVEHTAPPVRPLRIAELRAWVAEAFDAYPGRASIRKVQKHVDMLTDGRRFNSAMLRNLYVAERDRRAWERQITKLQTMKYSALTKLSRQVERIIVGGEDGPEVQQLGWARWYQPHIGAELDRRLDMKERLRPGKRRGATVEEVLILAEIDEQRRRQPAGRQGRRGGVCSPKTTPIATQGDLFSSAPALSPYHAAALDMADRLKVRAGADFSI